MAGSSDHEQALRAAAGGDDQALERLLRAYHDRIYRYGRRVCRDSFDADDAVQTAFVALARRPDVVGDPGALSWLMTVVKNACLRLLRRLARTRVRLEEITEPEAPALDAESALQRWRLVHLVHQAIARLERPYREVLVLRDVEGQSGEEVCAALGLTEAAMKSRLHRARLLVRQMVRDSGGQGN